MKLNTWFLMTTAAMLVAGCTGGAAAPKGETGKAPATDRPWTSVFDGKTLTGWKVTDFENHGDVRVADGQLILDIGKDDLTGVTWTGAKLPTVNYEIELEANRVDGQDFFCGLTFPVKDSYISYIVGGWGGTLGGLSSLEGYDAANNETTFIRPYENGRWYRMRVLVTAFKVQAWIDGEQVIDGKLTRLEDGKAVERKISVRYEVEASRPFGLAAFRTKAALRNIRYRLLTPAEVEAAGKEPL
jgi:hypothetical protein